MVDLCENLCVKKGGGIAETLGFLHTHTHTHTHTYIAVAKKNLNNLLVTKNIRAHTKSLVWDFLYV